MNAAVERDPVGALRDQRAGARVQVARLMASVAEWENLSRYLEALDLPSAQPLKNALHDLYGHGGNLLAELAPWRDPGAHTAEIRASPAPVVVPEDEEPEEEHAAAV